MDKNQKSDSPPKKKQKDDIRMKGVYSPTECFSKMAFFESKRLLKKGEVKARLKFSNFLKTTREEIGRDHPEVNLETLRKLEEYHIGETSKRREEVKVIEREMREIDERAQKHWPKK